MTAIQKMQQASKSALLSYILLDRVPRELVGTTGAESYTLASVCLHALALFSSARCFSGLQVLAPPDLSRTCPLGWLEDVSHDCLAPAGYTGRCVGRKNFNGMRRSEKDRWARECHVTW